MAKKEADTVYKIVEVVGVSEKSWEDAGRAAVKQRPARCATCVWLKSRRWT
jgi:flavin-binding protein dodecin